MKKIEALGRPDCVKDIRQSLLNVGIANMTLLEAKAMGEAKGPAHISRGIRFRPEYLLQVKMDAFVGDKLAQAGVGVLINAAKDGGVGSGSIFFTNVEEAAAVPVDGLEEHGGDEPKTVSSHGNPKRTIKALVIVLFLLTTHLSFAQEDQVKAPLIGQVTGEPFAWGDFTWLNGNDRRHSMLLDTKYFTGRFLLDANYTASSNHPIDHTVVGSTALARDNEFQISVAALGGDFHYDNVRGTVLLQLGTRATVVPRNDYSVLHGQFDLANAYRYFSEANAGYHFDVWHGINVDAGLFMSYVGLFSYYNAENWSYQPSFTSDNTPWFFNGLRVQAFPTDRLKIEFWLTNGWQSYAKFNNGPGVGCQILYRPEEWISVLSNNYYGTDVQDNPDRIRFHTDNSVLIRYHNAPESFINRAAFSVTGDLGFENGGGVSGLKSGPNGPAQFFISGMVYNRLWMANDHIGWTIGGGFIHNPGRYLVLYPTGDANPIPAINTGATGAHPFSANPGDPFYGWDVSTTFDWMPNDLLTWRFEVVHREADVPYFAGPGGVTSPDGYNTTPLPAGWSPDLVKSETRFIFATLVRF